MLDAPNSISSIFDRLTQSKSSDNSWDVCVEIAREMGADALNAAKFKDQEHIPLWVRVSTHELGGLDGYVASEFIDVDPILVARAKGKLKEVDHVSLHERLQDQTLTQKERICYNHLLEYGQSDYITFRIGSAGESEELLPVFACDQPTAEMLLGRIDQLSVIANLLALFITPPTPSKPTGKVPLLYEFLTQRERSVLELLARGMTNKEVAHELGITEVTVRLHTTGARKKMGATTRAQAIALALTRDLISP